MENTDDMLQVPDFTVNIQKFENSMTHDFRQIMHWSSGSDLDFDHQATPNICDSWYFVSFTYGAVKLLYLVKVDIHV